MQQQSRKCREKSRACSSAEHFELSSSLKERKSWNVCSAKEALVTAFLEQVLWKVFFKKKGKKDFRCWGVLIPMYQRISFNRYSYSKEIPPSYYISKGSYDQHMWGLVFGSVFSLSMLRDSSSTVCAAMSRKDSQTEPSLYFRQTGQLSEHRHSSLCQKW